MPIVSGNNELRDLVIAGNDGDFAELVQVHYKDDRRPDPSRADVQISAILRTDDPVDKKPDGVKGNWRGRHHVGSAKLVVSFTVLSQIPKIREGDVVAVFRDGSKQLYEVGPVDARGHVRAVLPLTKLGTHTQ